MRATRHASLAVESGGGGVGRLARLAIELVGHLRGVRIAFAIETESVLAFPAQRHHPFGPTPVEFPERLLRAERLVRALREGVAHDLQHPWQEPGVAGVVGQLGLDLHHVAVTHRLVAAGVRLDLGAVDGHRPELHQPHLTG